MPSCRTIQNHLSAYRDGALPTRQREQVQRHLAGCAGCRRELAILDRIDDALLADAPLVLSPRADARFTAGMAERRIRRPVQTCRPNANWLRLGWAAGIALLLMLGTLLSTRLTEPPSLRVKETPVSSVIQIDEPQTAETVRETAVTIKTHTQVQARLSHSRPQHRATPAPVNQRRQPEYTMEMEPATPDVTAVAFSELMETAECAPPPSTPPGNTETLILATATETSPELAVLTMLAETME